MRRHRRLLPLGAIAATIAMLAALLARPAPSAAQASTGLNLSSANRRAPIAGLYDWSEAGYLGGASLPGSASIGQTLNATTYGVVANDGADDSAALQAAVDAARGRSGAGFNNLTLLVLPAGVINLSRQIGVDASYLIIRGQGSDPASSGSTRIVFRPDTTTRYDLLTSDGSQADFQNMTSGPASGGWIWPGRGAFRVQTRTVHPYYATDYSSAPANRKDLFEGSVNYHWRTGLRVRQSQPYAALRGDTVIALDSALTSAEIATLQPGGLIWVGAANSIQMYLNQGVTNTSFYENGHMRAQVFTIAAVNATAKTVTIDKPLEFDLPANNTADGSQAIAGTAYYSKVMPLTAVQGVGFENFYLTQDMSGMPKLGGGTYSLTASQAVNNYGNLAPEYAMHGIVFKWAANSWVKGVRMGMVGSHPIVTEVAKNLQIVDNTLDGAWNKGKGGNGYLRGSRVWDSIYAGNTTRNLRHFTFQWSASGNVAIGNDFDSDLNLHGGWERHNLLELNTVRVPFGHAPGNCSANCGGEGGSSDTGTWYPIWWGAGAKAGKWSGATGPQNVFFNNLLQKQLTSGGAYSDYAPYYSSAGGTTGKIVQFGWDRATTNGSTYEHLKLNGSLLADWAGSETVNFAQAPNAGVNANRTDAANSLFLITAPTPPGGSGGGSPPTPTNTPTPTPSPTPSSGPAGGVEVRASLAEDTNKQTKYDVVLANTGTVARSGLTARIYFDISELTAAGYTASNVACSERFDPSGATCTIKPYSGSVYYAELSFASTLAVNGTLSYKITLHLSNYAQVWSSANDYSRTGLTSTTSVTTRIPAYQGTTLLAGSNP